jgi:hypothetical protein
MDANQVVTRDIDTSADPTPAAEQAPERVFERPGDRSERFREDFRDAAREHGVDIPEPEPEPDEHKEASRRERKERIRAQRDLRGHVEQITETERDVQPSEAEAETAEQTDASEVDTTRAPPSWTKGAKAEFAKLPARIQQEVWKRERDMENGVAQLQEQVKQQYGDIDQALQPWHGEMHAFGKTPAQTISQMFGWYSALANNPDQAVPALLQSYNYPVARLVQAYGPDRVLRDLGWYAQRMPQGHIVLTRNPQAHAQQQFNTQLQQAVAPLYERFNQYEAQRNAEIEAVQEKNTQLALDDWSKSKPHFEEVRHVMATLLTPDATGRLTVPLKNGKVDLDRAYELACKMNDLNPSLSRKEVERREHAQRARRAAVSLPTSPPGPYNGNTRERPREKMSVRDTIRGAIKELRE